MPLNGCIWPNYPNNFARAQGSQHPPITVTHRPYPTDLPDAAGGSGIRRRGGEARGCPDGDKEGQAWFAARRLRRPRPGPGLRPRRRLRPRPRLRLRVHRPRTPHHRQDRGRARTRTRTQALPGPCSRRPALPS